MPFAATWMDLEIIILSEVNQRKTNTMNHLNVESKKMIQMNLLTKQKYSHRHRKTKLRLLVGGNVGGGINREIGTDVYTLLCIK